jgi:hypothetical protein
VAAGIQDVEASAGATRGRATSNVADLTAVAICAPTRGPRELIGAPIVPSCLSLA